MYIADQLERVRCISEFEGRDIDDTILVKIVEAATWAPSAANAQPWEIIAIRNHASKVDLVGTLLDSLLRPNVGGRERRSWVVQASVILVVCLDQMRAKARFGEIGEKLFGIQDSGAAVQNMRLMALEHGVGSCLIREFDHQEVAELLDLPSHVRPLIMIAMGYSSVEPGPNPRLPHEDYVHYETW